MITIKKEFQGLVISRKVVINPAVTLTLTLDTNTIPESRYTFYQTYFADIFEELEEVKQLENIESINTISYEQTKKKAGRPKKTNTESTGG